MSAFAQGYNYSWWWMLYYLILYSCLWLNIVIHSKLGSSLFIFFRVSFWVCPGRNSTNWTTLRYLSLLSINSQSSSTCRMFCKFSFLTFQLKEPVHRNCVQVCPKVKYVTTNTCFNFYMLLFYCNDFCRGRKKERYNWKIEKI